MPEGYTHVRTAQKAAAALHYKIQCPAAFAAGANGPDSLFCYEVWRKGKKRRYDLPALGSAMHEQRTGVFLQALCRRVKTRPQVEYALGFLCHYATDTIVHPFVAAMCEKGQPYAKKGGHGYLEIALDSTLHKEDTGSACVPAQDAAPLLAGVELADVCTLLQGALRDTYALDIPVEYLADAFYHTTKVRGLFTSRFGVRRAVYWLVEPLFGGRGFITGHVSPAKLRADLPDAWVDPFTGAENVGGLFALLPKAQKRSGTFMAAALSVWMGAITWQDFDSVIGAMSYSQGIATEESALQAASADKADAAGEG